MPHHKSLPAIHIANWSPGAGYVQMQRDKLCRLTAPLSTIRSGSGSSNKSNSTRKSGTVTEAAMFKA